MKDLDNSGVGDQIGRNSDCIMRENLMISKLK